MPAAILFRGGGGHAGVVWEAIAHDCAPEAVKILWDDGAVTHKTFATWWKAQTADDVQALLQSSGVASVACYVPVGSSGARASLVQQVRTALHGFVLSFPNAVHRTATVASSAAMGEGNYVGATAVLDAHAVVGDFCVVNSGAVVSHDSLLEDYVNVNPGAVLCGTVTLRRGATVGANAVVREKLCIARGAMLGMGGVLTRNIEEGGATWTGNPAKLLNTHYNAK